MSRETKLNRDAMFALAHAIGTPLTALQLGIDILARPELGPLTPSQREVVETLAGEIARLHALVGRSLDLEALGSYLGPYERVRLELSTLAREAIAPIASQAKARKVRLALRAPDLVPIWGHRVHLAWAIATLAGNALRYAPDESTVSIAVAARGDEAILRVRDRGPGMPAEVLEQIAHATLGPAYALVMISEIAARHGGALRIPSDARATTVELRLPLAPQLADDLHDVGVEDDAMAHREGDKSRELP